MLSTPLLNAQHTLADQDGSEPSGVLRKTVGGVSATLSVITGCHGSLGHAKPSAGLGSVASGSN